MYSNDYQQTSTINKSPPMGRTTHLTQPTMCNSTSSRTLLPNQTFQKFIRIPPHARIQVLAVFLFLINLCEWGIDDNQFCSKSVREYYCFYDQKCKVQTKTRQTKYYYYYTSLSERNHENLKSFVESENYLRSIISVFCHFLQKSFLSYSLHPFEFFLEGGGDML